jgi:predicted MPP superfamily phosphohydrolase
MKKLLLVLVFLLPVLTFAQSPYRFVFITDMHLQPERNAPQGFQKAIDKINELNPDFVLTGGDNIMDALGVDKDRMNLQFNLLDSMLKFFKMPVYTTMGNHDVFGIYPKSGIEQTDPEYGKVVYENKFAKRYYSFDHKGVHYLILDGISINEEKRKYYGRVDSEQMEWIKSDLSGVDKKTPIVVSIHIPLMTVFGQIIQSATTANDSSYVIANGKEVIELFKDYNLKLVLQGHLHFYEEISLYGATFVTVGALSGKWWQGPNMDIEEGFLLVDFDGKNFSYEYIDYGWNP